jgi:hypothetical protein
MLSSGALLALVAIPGIFIGLGLRERQAMRDLERSVLGQKTTNPKTPAR